MVSLLRTLSHFVYPDSAAFSYYSNLDFSGGYCHDMTWAAVKTKTAVATLFVFLATARDGSTDIVNFDDNSRLLRLPGGVLVPLSEEFCKATGEIVIFALHCEADYDAVFACVSSTCTNEVLFVR